MLLLDVASTSLNVGATSSRLTKVAHIADLLRRAAPDAELVAIIVSWLSGELTQRQIGVGWASLRELGFALAVGVLLDTFLVRPILVPAFVILIDRARSRNRHRTVAFPAESEALVE